MRIFAAAAVIAVSMLVSAQAPNGISTEGRAGAGPVCLHPLVVPGPGGDIHTKVLNPRTVLFYTPDGKVWVNRLKTTCRGLMFHGFVIVGHEFELCSNQGAIRVLESGEICELGSFVPYSPPPQTANP